MGSSKIKILWFSIIACAIPSLCLIPIEYFPTFFLPAHSNPTTFNAFSMSIFSFPDIDASNLRFCFPEYCLRNPGSSMIAPISFLSTRIDPSLIWSSPQIHLNKTVLPDPFLPIIPHIVPFFTCKDTLSNTVTFPNFFVTFRTIIAILSTTISFHPEISECTVT